MKPYKAGKHIPHKGYKPFSPSFINEEIEWPLSNNTNLAVMLQEASLLIMMHFRW